MTREEAQSVIMTEQKCVDRVSTDRCNRDCVNCDLIMDDAVINEAYNMAIKALEQPEIVYCKDCVYSRSDVWLYANGSATVDCYCTRTNLKISPNDFCSKPVAPRMGRVS